MSKTVPDGGFQQRWWQSPSFGNPETNNEKDPGISGVF
jgi:hypothetical protein